MTLGFALALVVPGILAALYGLLRARSAILLHCIEKAIDIFEEHEKSHIARYELDLKIRHVVGLLRLGIAGRLASKKALSRLVTTRIKRN